MQTRSRTTAASLVQIKNVLKVKNEGSVRIRKSIKRAIVSASISERAAGDAHPLEEKIDRNKTPEPGAADPTLAALTSPNSHRLVYVPPNDLHATFLSQATKHLISVDARFKDLLQKNHCHIYSPEGLKEGVDPFKSLVCGILSQQVSSAASRSITRKFVLLFTDSADEEGNPPVGFFPTPQQVLTEKPEVLRTAGLSGRKVEYILDLSARFADGRLKAEEMVHESDEEIIEKLVEVRGIGRWSMAPKRPDVLSTGDLGIQRGMAVWTGKNIAKAKGNTSKWKYMAEKEMIEEAEKWKPFRSLGAWCMWRVQGPSSAPVAP